MFFVEFEKRSYSVSSSSTRVIGDAWSKIYLLEGRSDREVEAGQNVNKMISLLSVTGGMEMKSFTKLETID